MTSRDSYLHLICQTVFTNVLIVNTIYIDQKRDKSIVHFYIINIIYLAYYIVLFINNFSNRSGTIYKY